MARAIGHESDQRSPRMRRARADASFRPPAREIARLRRALYAEAALFALIPLCAAAVARGYGM